MTECSRCGRCCDPVITTFDPQVLAATRLADDDFEDESVRYQYEFFRDHWKSVGTFATHRPEAPVGYRVVCDQYDPSSRSCLAQESKPDICSGFPWYGREPRSDAAADVAAALLPQCSFNADVRRMLPIVAVT